MSCITEVNITDSLGSMLVGSILSIALWGVNCVQLFWYFGVYATDPLYTKTLVVFLWIFDTADHILVLQGLWNPLIAHWGNRDQLVQLQPTETHHVWVSAVVALGVQLFFIYRVMILSGRRFIILPAILTVLAFYQISIAISYTVMALHHSTQLDYLQSSMILALQVSDRACTVTVDIGITLSVVWFLLKAGIPKWTSSRQLVFRIILVTINSNMWTAIVALIDFCLVVTHPNNLTYTILELTLPSLYFGSLLGNLNARRFIKDGTSTINEFLSVLPEEYSNRSRADSGIIVFRKHTAGTTSTNATENDPENGIPMIKVERSQITHTDYGAAYADGCFPAKSD